MRAKTYIAAAFSYLALIVVLSIHCGPTIIPVQNQAESTTLAYQRGPYSAARPSMTSNSFESWDGLIWRSTPMLRTGVYGHRRVNYPAGGPVTISPLGSIVWQNSGVTYSRIDATGASFALTGAPSACPTCGATVASTRYYMYIYDSSGAFLYERNTTPPDSNAFKPSDQSRVFAFSFSTDDGNAIPAFRTSDGTHSYVNGVPVSAYSSPACVLHQPVAAPANATLTKVRATMACSAGGGNMVLYQDAGCTVASPCIWFLNSNTEQQTFTCDVTGGSVYVKMLSGTCTIGMSTLGHIE